MNQQLVRALDNAKIDLKNKDRTEKTFGEVISEIASKWDELEELGLSDDICENLLMK